MAKKTQQSRNLGKQNTGSNDKDSLDELFFQLVTKIDSIKYLRKIIKGSDITRLESSNSAKKKRFNNYPAPSIQDILFYNTLTLKESSDIPFEAIISTITDKISILESIPDNSIKSLDVRRIIEFDINNSNTPEAHHKNPYYFSLDDILYYHSLFSNTASDDEQSCPPNFNVNLTSKTLSPEKQAVTTRQNIKRRWVESGESITIQGFQITCGLFYVGTDTWPSDISLINPMLPVEYSPHHLRQKITDLDEYPLPYKYMHPKGRGDYLAWLSKGRNPADCDISFVKLYLSGLERRVFCDISQHTNKKDTKKEVQDILCYIKNLLQHFNKSDQISRKIREFENFLIAYGLNKNSELHSRFGLPPDPIPPLGLLTSALEFSARDEAIPGYLAYDLWKEYRQDKEPSAVDYYPEVFKNLAIETYDANSVKKIKNSHPNQKNAKHSNAASLPGHFSLPIGYRPINCHLDSGAFLTRIEFSNIHKTNIERILSIDKIEKIAEAEQYNCLYRANQRNLLNSLSLPFILWPPQFREIAIDLPTLFLPTKSTGLQVFPYFYFYFFVKPK